MIRRVGARLLDWGLIVAVVSLWLLAVVWEGLAWLGGKAWGGMTDLRQALRTGWREEKKRHDL